MHTTGGGKKFLSCSLNRIKPNRIQPNSIKPIGTGPENSSQPEAVSKQRESYLTEIAPLEIARSGVDQSFPDRQPDESHPIVQVELLHHPIFQTVDRLHGEIHPFGDLSYG